VHHFALLAETATVVRRLRARSLGLEPRTQPWEADVLDGWLVQLRRPGFAQHIHTDHKTVAQVADIIAGSALLEVSAGASFGTPVLLATVSGHATLNRCTSKVLERPVARRAQQVGVMSEGRLTVHRATGSATAPIARSSARPASAPGRRVPIDGPGASQRAGPGGDDRRRLGHRHRRRAAGRPVRQLAHRPAAPGRRAGPSRLSKRHPPCQLRNVTKTCTSGRYIVPAVRAAGHPGAHRRRKDDGVAAAQQVRSPHRRPREPRRLPVSE
jgi:hypothetical protein